MNQRDLRPVWRKYRNGDHITDEELRSLIRETEAAVPYLTNRGPEYHLARVETNRTLITLKEIWENRRSGLWSEPKPLAS